MINKLSTRVSNQLPNLIFPDSKRSQITPFIIIGLVLLGSIGLYFVFKDTSPLNIKQNVPVDINPVYSAVDTCLRDTLSRAVDYVSKKGGYYDTPEKSIEMEIAYYIYKNEDYMPSKEKVAEEISKYINNDLSFCVNEFSQLPEFSVEEGEVSSRVTIENDRVSVKVTYPLSITKNEKVYKLENFESEFKVRLGLVYDIAKQIIDEQKIDRESICIGCLYDLSKKNDVYIKTLDYEDDMIYTITDENSKINNSAFVFNFVNKYN
ncbi:hypothetical protein J4218_01485 [Candidatus Pacearchaeota archaeon]|nr:hypothetical protein [Candidatus Pacearchaeota archaeon]